MGDFAARCGALALPSPLPLRLPRVGGGTFKPDAAGPLLVKGVPSVTKRKSIFRPSKSTRLTWMRTRVPIANRIPVRSPRSSWRTSSKRKKSPPNSVMWTKPSTYKLSNVTNKPKPVTAVTTPPYSSPKCSRMNLHLSQASTSRLASSARRSKALQCKPAASQPLASGPAATGLTTLATAPGAGFLVILNRPGGSGGRTGSL